MHRFLKPDNAGSIPTGPTVGASTGEAGRPRPTRAPPRSGVGGDEGSSPSSDYLDAQIRQPAERFGLHPELFAGSIPALGTATRLGRQSADHLGSGTDRGLVAGMLWVRVPHGVRASAGHLALELVEVEERSGALCFKSLGLYSGSGRNLPKIQ